MEQHKIDRINELAHLAKERSLTEEELAERDALRKEYIAAWRESTIAVLENTVIQTPDGKRHRLKKRGSST
jgi:uncharacterized protein YnzC (UPF0291/DUF896 family)